MRLVDENEYRRSASTRWSDDAAQTLIERPFLDLIHEAQCVHRENFPPNRVERAQLLSIKTGGCPEDCAYCSQSARHHDPVKATPLMKADAVIDAARQAKACGASRFCMGAAWRNPKDRDMDALCDMVRAVKALGLETCMTLGMLSDAQADRLAEAGLDYYNHNIDTAPGRYERIVTTRTFQDRLDTLERVRRAGVGVCCGGIIGMGESRVERARMLTVLANLPEPPGSVPINALMPQEGTPLENAAPIDGLEFARTVAAARIMMPQSVVRLSAGREHMSEELQALCFLAGANSIFVGAKLLTAGNPDMTSDNALFEKLSLQSGPTGTGAASCS